MKTSVTLFKLLMLAIVLLLGAATPSPTTSPTSPPTAKPTSDPTSSPTAPPTAKPTAPPTAKPSAPPTDPPTTSPTSKPTDRPTLRPTASPTTSPTAKPFTSPPTAKPTNAPSPSPTQKPSTAPTETPTSRPTGKPSSPPTDKPTAVPTTRPTAEPTAPPTKKPSLAPVPPTIRPTPFPTKKIPPGLAKPHRHPHPIHPITSNAPCFSAANTVEIEGGVSIAMKDLQVGDMVKDAKGEIVRVYSFGHYHNSATAEFLRVHVDGLNSPLEISKDHLMFVSGVAIPASTVKVGDYVNVENSVTAKVERIQLVIRDGVYAPFTTSGTIMVSGVAASSYVTLQKDSPFLVVGQSYTTSLSMHWLAHVFLTPQRLFCTSSILGMGNYCKKMESYSDDGISKWVEGPYLVFGWLLQQKGMILPALLIPVFAFTGALYLLEVGGVYFMAAAILTRVRKRQLPENLERFGATHVSSSKIHFVVAGSDRFVSLACHLRDRVKRF